MAMKEIGSEQTQEVIRDMLILLLADEVFVNRDVIQEARKRLIAVGILAD